MLSPVIADQKIPLPPPKLCPDCREQRRCAQGNQINLYERKCDLTGAPVISHFHPESPFKVYRQEDWFSDRWDPLQYGRDFDFSQPFFPQWYALSLEVPRPSLQTAFHSDENAAYTNYAGRNKNCYLIFDSDENRDCYYSYSIQHSENCMECYRVKNCELCYECIDSVACYSCAYLQDCDNCSDSVFLRNCIGCKHCLMCSNLRNKEYYIENKPVSKKEFETIRAMLTSSSRLMTARGHFEKLRLQYPQKYMHGVLNENVSGDYLTHCKNAYRSYDCNDLWDCRYCFQAFMGLKNCMDTQECGEAEKVYESAFVGYNGHTILFSSHTLGDASNILYSLCCPHSSHLFGCAGVMHRKYCIFNKQYSKEEYETLVLKIITHMQNTGEWGEYFPIQFSSFAYNETLAQDHYPLTREEVLKNGWKWFDVPDQRSQYMGPEVTLPDDIADADDAITSKILLCEVTRKPYKIIPQELKLYHQLRLPLPRKSFFRRHKERMKLRNPRRLWSRVCAKCSKEIETTYAPERPEIVYCDECYLASVY